MKKRKKLLKKHKLCTKGKFILRRKKEFMNFSDYGKVGFLGVEGYRFQRMKDDLSLVFTKLA